LAGWMREDRIVVSFQGSIALEAPCCPAADAKNRRAVLPQMQKIVVG